MNKIGAVAIIIGVEIFLYLILLVVMPVLTDIIVTSNATMTASSNLSNYPGTQGFFVSQPWILFFVPGAIGIAVIVIILKQP